MPQNIVVITGSPRAKGNSEILADAFIEGAKEAENNLIKFNAAKMKINGCTACEYCASHDGNCVQKDDMQNIYKAFHQADLLVLASPIYYYGFSAQLKAVIDRLHAAHGCSDFFSITSTVLLLTCEEDIAAAEAAILQYKAIIKYLKWKDKGVIVQEFVKQKGEILGKESLRTAKNLGKSFK